MAYFEKGIDPDLYFMAHPDHIWPAWKFDMDMFDMFNTLPQQFNKMTIPILDSDAFGHDLRDVSRQAQDRPEFLRLLQERMELRRDELLKLMSRSLAMIGGNPKALDEHPRALEDAMHIYHFKSFDTYVRYFAGYLINEDSPETNSHAPVVRHQDQHPSPRLATSISPAPSNAGDAAFSDRAPSPSASISNPSPRQGSTKPPQTQDSPSRVPIHRRRNQTTARSSGRIHKAGLGERSDLRRSSRLEQKRESKERRDYIEPPHTHIGDTGKRKRAQEETSREQPSAKKRKTGYTASTITEQKRKRAQESEIPGAQPSAKKRKTGSIASAISEQKRKKAKESEIPGAQPSAKKRKTGSIASAISEQRRKRGQEFDITGAQPSAKRKTGHTASTISEHTSEGATGEDYSRQPRITNATGQLRTQKRKSGSDDADVRPQTSQRQRLEYQTKRRKC
ncbi:hypothetical protein VPNG_03540 [Cytospora leucostoma]|uniref:Uncharacterized protein n=1 Tax=Cytospora leucostoma TaxID=1230097 RepID=A0A423XCP2_9PEZI|nr:hypothetical protein VPNG_03540 [Cytospora leucostoma]